MRKLYLILLAAFAITTVNAGPTVTDNHIKVDQFGYKSRQKKIAIISNPVIGYNNGSPFIPSTLYQVRRWSDDSIVYINSPVAWNSGTLHQQSGDLVWRFDFSSIITPGDYYIYDAGNSVGSYRFTISDSVYNNVLDAALHAYYYQRCGTAKSTAYAGTGWTDVACHTGTHQDLDARLITDTSAATSRDLHGGWHDAGDYNKYVNFTYGTIIDLMLAYEEDTLAWTDDTNIPESGNGVPDLLDEAKYELDWLLRMQEPDGSVLSVVGAQNFAGGSPPSADAAQRFYGPATASATFSAAAMFALAAIEYKKIPALIAYSDTLKTAAIQAWVWALVHPSATFYNSGLLAAGEQEVASDELEFRQIAAASFLYDLTGNGAYNDYFSSHYTDTHLMQWGYAYTFEHTIQDALLYYTKAPGATASISTAIKDAFSNSVATSTDNYQGFVDDSDAYLAYLIDNNYTWGSNQFKCSQASMYQTMNVYHLDIPDSSGFKTCAQGYIHYMHGVNPNSFTYLSNMSALGAENSVTQFYHSWFHDGSALWDQVGVSTYGPPPGFIPGGPNPTYTLDACCSGSCSSDPLCSIALATPPLGQPIQKSYADFNGDWPQNSWTVTEIAIYTQAAYLRLLSKETYQPVPADTTTAVAGIPAETISVYPNPAARTITVALQYTFTGNAAITLTDLSGRVIIQKETNRQNTTLDVSGLNAGIYLLEVHVDGVVIRRKIMKQ